MSRAKIMCPTQKFIVRDKFNDKPTIKGIGKLK